MCKIKKIILITIYFLCTSVVFATNSIDDHIRKSILVKGISENAITKGIGKGIWNNHKNAYAVSFETQDGCLCLILLKNKGKIKTINISQVEKSNFGKLGYPKSYYDKYKTFPTRWLQRNDGIYQIEFTTQAWKGKKRFTVREPLIIKSNGVPIYR